MKDFLLISQIIITIVLTLLILIQSKGVGLGRAWGSTASFTRRGLDKFIFKATFVLTFIFLVISVTLLVI